MVNDSHEPHHADLREAEERQEEVEECQAEEPQEEAFPEE